MHTQFSLSHFSSPHFSLFFLFSHLHYNVFNMYKALFTLCTPHFEIFPMIMFLALFLTHSLSPFARNKSLNRCVLFPFSFFQYGPPVTPVTLSMQEKKNERRKNKTKEREKNKKKKNGTTQLRKFVNRLPIRPGTNALEIVPVYLARSTPSHLSPFVSFDYKSNGWNVAAFTIHYPVVVLVPWARPFARTKFIESINSVARRTEAQDSRRDDTRKETKIYCNGLCDPRVRSELNETKF